MGKDYYEGCIHDREWRLNHLYFILSKDEGLVRFKLNWAQKHFLRNMHTRNIILKVRQLGMSTLSSMLIHDSCMFTPNFNAGIIDKAIDDGKEKLDKIRLAHECMLEPPDIGDRDHVQDPRDREAIANLAIGAASKYCTADIQGERALYSNGSKLRVATSMRGSTLQLLHISEFGHLAATNPQKAIEVLSGALAVPKSGCIIMESTHEGARVGEHYRMLKAAMENQGRELSEEDFKFFFYTWYKQHEYRLDTQTPLDTDMVEYFSELEKKGISLDMPQKRWYQSKARVLGHRVFTEYPTTPDEAFLAQVEGSIYGRYIARLRAAGQMGCQFPVDPYRPVYVSWDVGVGDSTAMWLIQPGGDGMFYIIDYYCANRMGTPHYLHVCEDWERTYDMRIHLHLLPHDMEQPDFGTGKPRHLKFAEAGQPYHLIKRIGRRMDGIDLVRDILPRCKFHARCNNPVLVDGIEHMSGVDALENYQMGPVGPNGVERMEPLHNACSHGADAFRMFAEALSAGFVTNEGRTPPGRIDVLRAFHKRKQKRKRGVPEYW